MPVPKRQRSHSRKTKRNANKGFKTKAFAACLQCKEPIAAHQVCKGCGYYKGVKILVTKAERAEGRDAKRKKVATSQEAKAKKAESKNKSE